jgi:hypothetical protein
MHALAGSQKDMNAIILTVAVVIVLCSLAPPPVILTLAAFAMCAAVMGRLLIP